MKSFLSAALTASFSAQAHALGAGKMIDGLGSLMSNRTVMIIVSLLFIGAALVMWMQNCKCCSITGGKSHHKKKHSKSPVRAASKDSKRSTGSSTSSVRKSPRKSKATF